MPCVRNAQEQEIQRASHLLPNSIRTGSVGPLVVIMARIGSGGAFDLLAFSTLPFKRAQGAPWTCAACRCSPASTSQRRHAHSRLDESVRASQTSFENAALTYDARKARRQAKLGGQDATSSAATEGPYPFRAFLARHQQGTGAMEASSAQNASHMPLELEEIQRALRQEDPTGLIAILASAMESNPASLRQIPRTTLTEMIRIMDPRGGMVAPIHSAHRAFTGRKNAAARAIFQHSRSSLIEMLSDFTHICHRAEVQLDLEHYRLLLKFVAIMGSNNMARTLWTQMERAQVRPDLECHNYRMEALLFNEGSRLLQSKAAKTVRNDHPEEAQERAFSRVTLFKTGDSTYVQKLLSELENQGIKADTRTYCNLITALARDGDLNGVVKILSSVWRLDVKAVMAGEAISHVSRIPPSDPLYPNSRLLVAIADAFGSHNSLGIAIRLTDIISQHYNVPVKRNVWFRLLQWTALYARLNNDEARRDGRRSSVLERSARRAQAKVLLGDLDLLLQTMTGPPYNVRPTMDMLHLLQKNALGQGVMGTPAFTQSADAGRQQYAQAVARYRERQHQMRADLSASQTRAGKILLPKKAARTERRTRALRMTKVIGHNYLNWWTHLIVQHAVPASTQLEPEEARGIEDWQLRGLPDFVLSNRAFVPSTFQYQTPGGTVQLVFRTGEDIEDSLRRKKLAGQRRRMKLVNIKKIGRPWDNRSGSWTGRSKAGERAHRLISQTTR